MTPHDVWGYDFFMPDKKTRYRAEVGSRLRLTREALEMDQGQIGIILAVGANAVSQYEKGVRLVDPEKMARLKHAKGVTLDWIYAGDPSGLSAALFKAATTPKPVAHYEPRKAKKQKSA